MFRKSLYETLDQMSYEQRKQTERELEQYLEDREIAQYDDSCNAVEVLIEAVGNCIISIINLFK